MNEYSFSKQLTEPQQYQFRVGNITSDGVTLVDNQYNIIQLPYSMLPHGSKSGSIIRLTLMRDIEEERKKQARLNELIERLENNNNDNFMQNNDMVDDSIRQSNTSQHNQNKSKLINTKTITVQNRMKKKSPQTKPSDIKTTNNKPIHNITTTTNKPPSSSKQKPVQRSGSLSMRKK